MVEGTWLDDSVGGTVASGVVFSISRFSHHLSILLRATTFSISNHFHSNFHILLDFTEFLHQQPL